MWYKVNDNMQSLIILGKIDKAKQNLEKIIKENNISKFDVQITTSEKAIGINDIKLLQKNLFLKPIKSEKKAVVLEAYYGMTTEAQNAFLKVLEEPPESTIIVILTGSLDFILPTILSRCNLINVSEKSTSQDTNVQKNLKLLNQILDGDVNPLVIAQGNGKDKQTALNFLEGLIIAADKNLSLNPNLAKVLKKIQKTYSLIKSTNVNVRFALENLFLNL